MSHKLFPLSIQSHGLQLKIDAAGRVVRRRDRSTPMASAVSALSSIVANGHPAMLSVNGVLVALISHQFWLFVPKNWTCVNVNRGRQIKATIRIHRTTAASLIRSLNNPAVALSMRTGAIVAGVRRAFSNSRNPKVVHRCRAEQSGAANNSPAQCEKLRMQLGDLTCSQAVHSAGLVNKW
jgi:hypothetical protein